MRSLVLLWNGLLISCLMVYSNESPCIIIWDTDLHTGERKQELKGGPHDVFSLRQLSNGQLASDSATLLSDYGTPDKGECQKVLKGHTNDVISLVVLLNGQLVFGSYGHRIKLWDIDTCKFKEILKGHTGFVWSLVLLWDGQLTSGANTISYAMPR